MTKTDLIEAVATKTSMTKKDAGVALNATIEAITEALKNKDSVQIPGFLTLKISHREAKMMRNPKSGEMFEAKAKNVVKVSVGKTLADAVN